MSDEKAGFMSESRTALPVIDVSGQPRDVLREVWDVVFAVNSPPRFFQRGGVLVCLSAEDGCGGLGVNGQQDRVLQRVTKDALAGLLVEHADWVRDGRNVLPPEFILRLMIAKPHPALPELEMVSSVPVLTATGRLISEPGYDPEGRVHLCQSVSGLVFRGCGADVQDCAAACRFLQEELLGDFPFTADSDRAHALAAILTHFVRPFLGNACAPLIILTASTPGTGKTLFACLLSEIVAERPPAITTANAHDGELRKKLTSFLLQATPVVVLDNISHELLDSSSLASVLTAPVWTDRLLGRSRAASVPNQTLWMATGNNPRLSMELARRSVRIRLDAQIERPWLRSGFRHPDLMSWVREHRPELVRACLTLVQTWLDAGRPHGVVQPLGSFEVWSRTLGGILDVAGVGGGFLADLNEMYREVDAEGEAWRILTQCWWARFQGQYVRVTDLLPMCVENDLFSDVLGQGTERSQKSRLGHALQRNGGRVFNGMRIEKDLQSLHNSGRYRLRPLSHSV